MTSHQQTVVNQLRQEYWGLSVAKDPATQSVTVNCFPGGFTGSKLPTKTFRVSPSGFTQDVTPERVAR